MTTAIAGDAMAMGIVVNFTNCGLETIGSTEYAHCYNQFYTTSSADIGDYAGQLMVDSLTELGYTCTNYAFADSNDVASVAANACVEMDVLYIPTDNTAASCTEAIRNVVEPAGIPVIAGEEGICSGCGVATLSISYYDLGVATGEMAYEVLVNGADVSTMPVQFAPNFDKKYNAELCDILGVAIPEGYVAIG